MPAKDRATSFRREMELLMGALKRLEHVAEESEPDAVFIVQKLVKTINRIEEMQAHNNIGDDLFMRKTYDIQLKIDFEDASRHKIAMHLMRKAARTILTQANMIADGREPQIALTTDDFFEGGTIESLQELSEIQEVGDGIVPQENE